MVGVRASYPNVQIRRLSFQSLVFTKVSTPKDAAFDTRGFKWRTEEQGAAASAVQRRRVQSVYRPSLKSQTKEGRRCRCHRTADPHKGRCHLLSGGNVRARRACAVVFRKMGSVLSCRHSWRCAALALGWLILHQQNQRRKVINRIPATCRTPTPKRKTVSFLQTRKTRLTNGGNVVLQLVCPCFPRNASTSIPTKYTSW